MGAWAWRDYWLAQHWVSTHGWHIVVQAPQFVPTARAHCAKTCVHTQGVAVRVAFRLAEYHTQVRRSRGYGGRTAQV